MFPAGRAGLARIWTRRWLEGRRERDFRALVRSRLSEGHYLHALAEGRWEETLRLGAVAAEADRYDDMAYAALAAAAAEMGRWEEAVRRWEQAIRLRRTDPTAWYHKGLAHAARGEKAPAAAAFARALDVAGPRWPLASPCRAKLAELK
jgi:tetratricopeptide (TPR) repeat protein